MLRILDEHTQFIGKICKLTEFGVCLEVEYEKLFGIGSEYTANRTFYYCHLGGRYEMSLMFIDEPPIKKESMTWFCLKEIGVGVSGDYHWHTLDQIIICK